MTATWIIEGRDPLIFRDGRPVGGSAPIKTLDFPLPSTLAGAVRGRLATDPKTGLFTLRGDDRALDQLVEIPVRGPLLAELATDSNQPSWLFPAPRDALVRETEDGPLAITRLRPEHALENGECVADLADRGLSPVFPDRPVNHAKPPSDPIVFWRLDAYARWLAGEGLDSIDAEVLGIRAFPHESRMHVSMRPGERVAEDGALFETVGLRFIHAGVPTRSGRSALGQHRHFALSFDTPGGTIRGKHLALRSELAPLGGERRIARWWPAPTAWPDPPQSLVEAVVRTKMARLILVTPALFSAGALPGWNGAASPTSPAVKVTVEAACVPAAQIVSGWDLRKKDDKGRIRGAPKPTRRMAAAGSVYFVRLQGSPADIRAWVVATWLQSVSDELKDRRDGFGLSAVGTWNE